MLRAGRRAPERTAEPKATEPLPGAPPQGGPGERPAASGPDIFLLVHSLDHLPFDNSYARLNPAFYEVVDPTPIPDPYLVAFNPDAAALIDLDPQEGGNPALLEYLGGARRFPGAEPIAQLYAGHQFGVWVPQLGDGRAILLGEVIGRGGGPWDLHLKGAGQTRFSRHGDGRSVLRSAVREYLASEALAGLGIPTTRALAIVGSNLPVYRERPETAATLLRMAPSHVRFGTFQLFASRGEEERVRELADYVLERHFPELAGTPERHRRFYGEVCRRTARLMARWMAVGFAHGVMNSDNMSILGLTLDFGPFGFLDDYDSGFICNHTDTSGRYAFDQQPMIGMWNCARLGEALFSILPLQEAQAELDTYWKAFGSEYARLMRAKLGLRTEQADDGVLLRDLLTLLQADRADFTGFFRRLSSLATLGRSEAWSAWSARYTTRLSTEGTDAGERGRVMATVNPKFVLRNWIAQEAIERAEAGDFKLIEELRLLFSTPFEEHPGMERFAEPPGPGARHLEVSCSS